MPFTATKPAQSHGAHCSQAFQLFSLSERLLKTHSPTHQEELQQDFNCETMHLKETFQVFVLWDKDINILRFLLARHMEHSALLWPTYTKYNNNLLFYRNRFIAELMNCRWFIHMRIIIALLIYLLYKCDMLNHSLLLWHTSVVSVPHRL